MGAKARVAALPRSLQSFHSFWMQLARTEKEQQQRQKTPEILIPAAQGAGRPRRGRVKNKRKSGDGSWKRANKIIKFW